MSDPQIDKPEELWPEERRRLPPEDRHEHKDIHIRGLLIVAAGLVALVVATLVVAHLISPRRPGPSVARPDVAPEAIEEPRMPRITQPRRVERLELERRVHERLSTYGWIDREAGVARIPVERAMELMLERGEW